jgi:hypothetical protein
MCNLETNICRLIEVNHRALFRNLHYDGDMMLQLRETAYDSAVARLYVAFDIDPTPLAFTTPTMSRVAYISVCDVGHRPSIISHQALRDRDSRCRIYSAATPQQLHVLLCFIYMRV